MRRYVKPTYLTSGAIVASPGIRSERDNDGELLILDSKYGVVIGDDVEICVNATIQRGTYRDTEIGDGTQIGPGANIGHNTMVGRRCFIAAGALVAGSVTIDDDVTIWQGAMIAHYVHIEARAVIGMGAVVLERVVPAGETWVGNPARRIR